MNQMNTRHGKQATVKLRIIRFIPAIVWMAVIFALSSRTGDELNTVLPLFQKLFPGMTDFNWGHFIAYFLLAATFDYGFGARSDRVVMKILLIVMCGVYGITDEIHQSYVGGRMTDLTDVRNDMIGAAIWTIVVSIPFVRKRWKRWAT